jgi:hypothetical protein
MRERLSQLVSFLKNQVLSGAPIAPNQNPGTLPYVAVLDGGEVALEVLQAIGYRAVLKNATIVSYTMHDYDFWGQASLSHLLLRQLALGASVRLMTTPPPGKTTSAGFKAKYTLVKTLQQNGVEVFFNDKLHAKAYLFVDTNGVCTAIVGSSNLTGPGFGMRLAPQDNLVEMNFHCTDGIILKDAIDFVENRIVNDNRTEDYATWLARNIVEIGKAGI